ncbi:MFS transporter [Streptosporangium sp. CA-135522]|uniref:MFS transporter n=1 Tax=Streptosporangium sp. CA-135522 TaxID=3240072 RepID=UPI003D929736
MSVRMVGTRARTAYCGFAVFGAFWGVWGASVPAIRDRAGLTDGELGAALLFIGAGALPAMLTAGRAVDRWGHRLTAALLVLLGVVGIGVAVTAADPVSLSAGLTLLGAASGAADVAVNSAAGSAESAAGRPVITRAHGVFSTAVVGASLVTGLFRGVAAPVVVPFALVALAAVGAGLVIAADARRAAPVRPGRAPEGGARDRRAVPDRPGPAPEGGARGRSLPRAYLPVLLVAGALGALAFAVENAHQSWSAVYLADILRADPVLASAGPAVFAAVVALTRFAAGSVRSGPGGAMTVLILGAVAAAAGTVTLALATAVPAALFGLALAAAGTAVLFPTLLSLAAAGVRDSARGAATSIMTTVAYLGFLAGPVYVGYWAQVAGLPGAMLAVSALAGALALITWPALRAAAPRSPAGPSPEKAGSVPEEGAHGGPAETGASGAGPDAPPDRRPAA